MVPADGQAPVWHEDVRFFQLLKDGQPKAWFYLDPYSRCVGQLLPGALNPERMIISDYVCWLRPTHPLFRHTPVYRPAEKRGGAWMAEVVGRSKLLAPAGSRVRLPVAHMVCNQSPPIGGKPSLMTFREVETLFHEFGHALQVVGVVGAVEGVGNGEGGVEAPFPILAMCFRWLGWLES